ncbi:MAG: BBP7 family outer membrane beta-barrel protein [Pirellulales bacterium]
MRFVARLAIAIATLVSSAILCWGQSPLGASAGGNFGAEPTVGARAMRRSVGFTGQAPSSAVEGTWVADDDAYEEEEEMVAQTPAQPGLEAVQIDESSGGPGGQECDCEQCQAAAAGSAGAHRPRGGLLGCRKCTGGGLCGPLWCSDLWNDVHAHRRVYVQADYLSFWTKGNQLPVLVTTSPLGTPQSQAGVLPESATTAILFGGERVDLNQRNGGRINVGYWLIDGEFLGIEGQYLALEEQNTLFDAVSDFSGGDPNAQILARPFFNVDPILITPTEDAAIVAFPAGFTLGPGTGTLDGSIHIRTTSNLQSAGGLLRRLVWIDFTMQRRLDWILGYRFFRIDDSVTINDASTFIPSAGPIPLTEFTSQDQFSASNQFHGGEIGLKAQSYHGRLSLEVLAKCAFGNNRQSTFINGFNTVTSGGVTTENVGGLLAQPTNIGMHRRNVFAVLPEANANIRWDITCHLRGTIGYTFMYINRVQRSGEAIDVTVNPTQFNAGVLDGEARPAFHPTDTPFWAHGATAGIEYRW